MRRCGVFCRNARLVKGTLVVAVGVLSYAQLKRRSREKEPQV